ncbi:uncharacterized protein LOC144128598 [Amblyomma americanum]
MRESHTEANGRSEHRARSSQSDGRRRRTTATVRQKHRFQGADNELFHSTVYSVLIDVSQQTSSLRCSLRLVRLLPQRYTSAMEAMDWFERDLMQRTIAASGDAHRVAFRCGLKRAMPVAPPSHNEVKRFRPSVDQPPLQQQRTPQTNLPRDFESWLTEVHGC